MEPAASIRKLGFRKWYERQLIDSHLSLAACLLSGVTIAAIVEEMDFAGFGTKGMLMIGLLAATILITWRAWRRYITVLERAERYGQRSSCPQCECYGRFEVLSSGIDTPTGVPVPLPSSWLRVQCRKCGTAWTMP